MSIISLFLAVFPDRYSATHLTHLANSHRAKHGLRGMPLAENRFHVTLHPLGYDGYVEDFMRHVSAAAEEAAGPVPPFKIEFDRAGSFGGNRPFVLRS